MHGRNLAARQTGTAAQRAAETQGAARGRTAAGAGPTRAVRDDVNVEKAILLVGKRRRTGSGSRVAGGIAAGARARDLVAGDEGAPPLARRDPSLARAPRAQGTAGALGETNARHGRLPEKSLERVHS